MVKKVYGQMYTRLGGLPSPVFTIKAGPGAAPQAGRSQMDPAANGYRVTLRPGDRAGDLWLLPVDAIGLGLVKAYWIVEVDVTGTVLLILDPATVPNTIQEPFGLAPSGDDNWLRGSTDWPMRDVENAGDPIA